MKLSNLQKSIVALIIFGSLAFGTACSTALLRESASGQIGCSKDEILISNEDKNDSTGVQTWIATCKGRRFFCSMSSSHLSCKEELQSSQKWVPLD